MEKESNLPEEDNDMQEPAIAYQKRLSVKYPYSYSKEEIEEQIKQGIEEKKQGIGVSHDEMKKRFHT